MVTHVAETEIRQQSWAQSVVKTSGDALVPYFRVSGKVANGGVARKGMSAKINTKEPGTRSLELLEAVTPEDVHLAGGYEIRAHVEPIGIERVVARAEEVIP